MKNNLIKNYSENNLTRFFKKWWVVIISTTSVGVISSIFLAKFMFPTYFESDYIFPSEAYAENALTRHEDVTLATIMLLQDPYMGIVFSEEFFNQLRNMRSKDGKFDPYRAFIKHINLNKKQDLSHKEAINLLSLYLNRSISKIVSEKALAPWFGFFFLITNEKSSGWQIKIRISDEKYGKAILISAFKALEIMIESFNKTRKDELRRNLKKAIKDGEKDLEIAEYEYNNLKKESKFELQSLREQVSSLEERIIADEKKFNLYKTMGNNLSESSYFQMSNWLAKLNASASEQTNLNDMSDYSSLTSLDYLKINDLALRISRLSQFNQNANKTEFYDLEKLIELYSANKNKHRIVYGKYISAQSHVLKLIKIYDSPLDPGKFALGKPIVNAELINSLDNSGFINRPQSLMNIFIFVGLFLGLLMGSCIGLIVDIYYLKSKS